MERNAREAREEREAAEKAAAQAAREQADAAAKAQAEAATAGTKAEGSRNQPPLLAIPLQAVAPDTLLPLAEEIVQDPPLMERREDLVAFTGRAPPVSSTGAGQGGQSSAAPEEPAEGEPEDGAGFEVQPMTRRRAGEAPLRRSRAKLRAPASRRRLWRRPTLPRPSGLPAGGLAS